MAGPDEDAEKHVQVQRILERYLVEVVEQYELCPWARTARLGGELSVAIEFGTPSIEQWIAAARKALARPATRVAMVIAPELAIDLPSLHAIRNYVAEATGAGVAEFHPDAPLDLGTPARLVPFLRRSPDPMLQLVPLALLASVRAQPVVERAQQAQILGGHGASPRDIADQIARVNYATVAAHHAELARTLEDIAADRRVAYARVAIACR